MIRKAFFIFLMVIITLFFTTFNVTGIHAKMEGEWLTSHPVFTPQPTRMPYEQQLLFTGQQRPNPLTSTIIASSSPVRGRLGDWRLLEYDAASLPLNPATATFGVVASRVYGRNGILGEGRLTEQLVCFGSHS
jgi:hypothetical protein